MSRNDDHPRGQRRETPTFDEFLRHATELRDMQRELRSRQGDDPAIIIEAEGALPSVLEIAVELALDDAQEHGELADALAYAERLADARAYAEAIEEAWSMAGEAIVWEAGRRAAPTVRSALQRRGVLGQPARPGRDHR